MNDFTLARFGFRIELMKDGYLPPYKGSTIRGALGTALRMNECAAPETECCDCSRVDECMFVFLFKPDQHKGKSIPAPYVIDPPVLKETCFKQGDMISFRLTLFGRAAEHIGRWIAAAAVCGTDCGLGPNRIPFRLREVDTIAHDGKRMPVWREGREYEADTGSVRFGNIKADIPPARDVSVHLMSPMRFKKNGSICVDISADDFLKTVLRRIKSIANFYHSGETAESIPKNISSAASLRNERLRWVTLERKSALFPDAVNIGGYTGTFELHGLQKDDFHLLKLGELTHAGKNTVYGCGKYTVSSLS